MTWAAIAWVIAAVLMAYLALLQLSYAGTLGDDGSLQALALWNGIAAAITLFAGIRLYTKPTRRAMDLSAAWGILNVAAGVIQVAGGATHEVFLAIIVACGVAAGLSWAARQRTPKGISAS